MTTDDKPLSATERAAKIIGMAQILSRTSIAMIAAEIESAVSVGMLLQMKIDQAYKNKCVAKAYEDAAKIAKDYKTGYDTYSLRSEIADAIHAKAKELK